MKTSYRTCPLCEATCGLTITTDGREMTAIRGDDDDVFSHGFLCPKAYALKELDDRSRSAAHAARAPRVDASNRRRWDEAFAEIERGLLARSSPRTAATRSASYLGNPNAHNLSGTLYVPALLRALGTRNVFSASTVDQMPKQVSARPDVRHRPQRPGAGHRPHRLSAHARRQPARLERQPADRARHAGPPAALARARRHARRRRPAPHPDRRRGRRAPRSSVPAPTRPPLRAWCTRSFAEGLVAPGRARPARRRASTRSRRSPRDFTPEAVAARLRHRRRRRSAGSRASSPPRRAPRSTAASAPARRSSARSRAGSSTC